MEVSDQLHTPAAVLLGKGPRYPLYRRLGGSHKMSGCYGEENVLSLSVIEPQLLGCPARSLVTTHTELFRLLILIETVG
jgi:hypothetical protein